jgi:enoyl-CoA hydratase
MSTLVTYRLRDSVATITMDDGKVNALSRPLLTELGAAFDRAAADRAVVVLTGREGVFSAGFDLPVLRAGGTAAARMLHAGFELAERMLAFPTPVLVAAPNQAAPNQAAPNQAAPNQAAPAAG